MWWGLVMNFLIFLPPPSKCRDLKKSVPRNITEKTPM
ncbi:rCG43174 [Rattus norvegicus]|uniref:RCG43174 n=1 Tax=Rattus norvegicus TaxID=10116 RepID=A6IW74_RAT|nr:rCG43174 [Rattus norvegicus]